MATGAEVLGLLRPNNKWTIIEDDYLSITFHDDGAITEEEFLAGFALADAARIEAENELAARKKAICNRLGITEEEARLLLA
jgi:hypothetical protein